MKYLLFKKLSALMKMIDDMQRLYTVDTVKPQPRYGGRGKGTALTRGKRHKSLKIRANRRKSKRGRETK